MKRSAGRWGEDLALEYLQDRGFVLVERNYRTSQGEIDLILRDGATLVFYRTEQKWRPQKLVNLHSLLTLAPAGSGHLLLAPLEGRFRSKL